MADRTPDAERLRFLYGDDVELDEWDLDDLEDRSRLLEDSFEEEDLPPARLLVREIVANQIFDDDPPEVWAAVVRMQSAGADRDRIFSELAMSFVPVMRDALAGEEPWNRDAYAQALASLPLPSAEEIEGIVLDCVRTQQGIAADDLDAEVLTRLGRTPGEEPTQALVDRVVEQLVEDFGPLAWLSGDRTVHVEDLVDGAVLTHRLSEQERSSGVLDAGFDLSVVLQRDDLHLTSGAPLNLALGQGVLGWEGPPAWLEGFPSGALLGFQVADDGEVSIQVVADEPGTDAQLVGRLRLVYDEEVAEPWIPVAATELILGLCLGDRSTFEEPRAPLSDLADAAGLERRGDWVAHEESVWHAARQLRRSGRVMEMLDHDPGRSRRVLHALDVADLTGGLDPSCVPEVESPLTARTLRDVLADLADDDVLSTVALELFDDHEPNAPERAEAFIAALSDAATKPRAVAVAALLAALQAEHVGDAARAERELARAHAADADNALVTERLAWYASVRGDATRASALWRSLEWSETAERELRMLRSVAGDANDRKPGRNEPCWCGSGRKYKQCHLGAAELPPLPDRVGWLCRKAVGYLERRGDARYDVIDVAAARAVDPTDDDRFAEALEDPIVMDLVLCEGGWFDRFLDEVGDLLPDDEALLCRAWTLVDRTVYQITEVRPGEGTEVRDLRTGDLLDVRERSFSMQATSGMLVCGRAVPDGETHQFIGGILPVPVGREADLLDVLDEANPVTIAEWVSALFAPPSLQTREGEPHVDCRIEVDFGDAEVAREFLRANYEPEGLDEGDTWVELFPIDDDERIVRARLHQARGRVSVHTTSEARADRVLEAIRRAVPEAVVRSDEREPFDWASVAARRADQGEEDRVGSPSDDPEMAGVLLDLRERWEQRWCDESIPALDGLTPREAAADPTRREQLERLLVSFETPMGDPDVAMRPEQLRQILGL